MDIIAGLQNKNDVEGYELLLQLETKSKDCNELYEYFDDFIELLKSKSSYVRVRGFRLACVQAKWDKDNKLEKNLDTMLCILVDEKPTAVRKCLEVLHSVVLYKSHLNKMIEDKLNTIDFSKYNDSMATLIKKDIEKLRKEIISK